MNIAQQTDEELMRLVQLGDQDAFSQLYDRYAGMVVSLSMRIIHDRTIAEEIMQETFWRVWDKADSFNNTRGSYKAWMISIARRHAIDIYRRQRSRPQIADDEGAQHVLDTRPDKSDVLADVSANLDGDALLKALDELSSEQRDVIVKAYYEGKTRREIAGETGIPLGTVHTRARLALRRLSDVMRKYR